MHLIAAAEVPEFMGPVAAIVVAGAVVAWLSQRLGIVPIVGFLVAGVLIGPNALAIVEREETVEAAAEVGVILLLFTIGIEFSLERLARVKKLVIGGGALTVASAIAATTGIAVLTGTATRPAIYTGLLVSVSSTAVVLSILAGRSETTSPSGQMSVAVLIFEDLAVVAMVLLVPILGTGGGSLDDLAASLVTAAVVIAFVLVVARRVMPPVLESVARLCSPEVFLIAIVAICFATAYLTGLAGVSVSLGAFLAGLVVSESRHSTYALGEILPLQIVFTATFFLSVGMLLDPSFLVEEPLMVAAAVVGVLVIKALTGTLAARIIGVALPVALGSALLRAQIGEFSFVLELSGREEGLTPLDWGADGIQAFLATTVLLMMLTPVLGPLGARLGARAADRAARAAQSAGEPDPLAEETSLSGHVVIAGYGRHADQIAAALELASVPFLITTLSPAGASHATALGREVLIADVGRRRTMELAGVARARVVVIADDEAEAAERIATGVRSFAPEVPVMVGTRLAADAERLTQPGHVWALDEESAVDYALVTHLLGKFGITDEAADALVGAARQRADAPPPPATRFAAGATTPGPGSAPVDTGAPMRLVVVDPCEHAPASTSVWPSAPGCEDCLREGMRWVHLRICLACGRVGCCDSSPGRHASAHAADAGHPVVRSLEPDETWAWCYVDERLLATDDQPTTAAAGD